MSIQKKYSPAEFSEFLQQKLHPIARLRVDDELYKYNGKYYEYLTYQELAHTFYNYLLGEGMINHWSTTLEQQTLKALTYHPNIELVEEFDNHPNHINVQNGVIDISSKYPYKLLEHDYKYHFTSMVDVDYDPEITKAPHFISFLETSITDDKMKPDMETIEAILMMCGYMLYPQHKLEGIFMFLGEGENGKSLLIDVLSSFFHERFVSSLSLREISQESMDREPLIHSRLNIASEEKGSPIDPSQIKKVASGQRITIKRKFKQPINVISRTKIVVDSNTLVQFKDNTHGTTRRLNIFNFLNKAVSQKDYDACNNPTRFRYIVRKNRDEFFPKIMKEKSAILNLFLDGLEKLKLNDWRMPRTMASKRTLDEYKDQTDTLGGWLRGHYIIDDDAETTTLDILNHFKEFYEQNFPGTRFGYSTHFLGRKIKEIFRVDYRKKGLATESGGRTTMNVYPLIRVDNPLSGGGQDEVNF